MFCVIWEEKLKIKLFQDGAELDKMIKARDLGLVNGFTTNPTLMKKAGIKNYEEFARKVIKSIPDLPISFEVFSDDFSDMEKEARRIQSWGGNTYIKIPITNTRGESAAPLIKKLSSEGFSLNITAIMDLDQVSVVARSIDAGSRTIVSVFAGRIADTGVDPIPLMKKSLNILSQFKNAELLWASPREALNIVQAEECGCHIITATPDLIAKLPLFGKSLSEFSLETVKMFYNDAKEAGYRII